MSEVRSGSMFESPRDAGKVRVRWFGDDSTAMEFETLRLDDVLSQAVRSWFPSNHSPDRFVLPIVVERDGLTMTDEEADEYLRKELGVERGVREHRERRVVPPRG